MTAAVKVPYRVNLEDVPEMHVTPPSQEAPSTISVKMVYGSDTGMMVARREKGYHSRPHRHDSEQWNYVLDGEIWFFIDKDGFRCVKGDIVRVPRNLVHWTWVRARAGCLMVESHTPQLTGDPDLADARAMPCRCRAKRSIRARASTISGSIIRNRSRSSAARSPPIRTEHGARRDRPTAL